MTQLVWDVGTGGAEGGYRLFEVHRFQNTIAATTRFNPPARRR